jgi:4-amino-4-deoxy-L-arabinose transferase-like glycosyltransferase
VLRRGRRRDYLIAGIGLGLGCASKYTAGIAVLPLAAALASRYLDAEPAQRARVLTGVLLASAAGVAAFLLANPYAIIDYQSFHRELVHQSTLSAESQGKLGSPKHGGIAYYLWSLTWGLGWLPALAALGGALSIWRSEARLGWLLVPAPIAFLAFMGLQGRYFGRWLMPILPILCLLAAFFIVQLAGALTGLAGRRLAQRSAAREVAGAPARTATRRPSWVRAGLLAALSGAALAQGLLHSIHAGLVLSRADTRNLTRSWMLAHVPAGAAIVAEPVSPDEWARQTSRGTSTARNPYQWAKYPSLVSRISPAGALEGAPHLISIENYERTLSPALIDYYVKHGYCWVLTGSAQYGRAFADPAAVPQAVAYYRALAARGEVVYRASPYSRGAHPVPFGFDWSFDYYPLAYERPGPQITVYRLHGGRCPR